MRALTQDSMWIRPHKHEERRAIHASLPGQFALIDDQSKIDPKKRSKIRIITTLLTLHYY